jgi:hypothetical protein
MSGRRRGMPGPGWTRGAGLGDLLVSRPCGGLPWVAFDSSMRQIFTWIRRAPALAVQPAT